MINKIYWVPIFLLNALMNPEKEKDTWLHPRSERVHNLVEKKRLQPKTNDQ